VQVDVSQRAVQLRAEGVPYALATVVRVRAPSSGKPGDRAIVTADRRLEGWVGGACAESVVTDEALAALAAGRPRYVVLDADAPEPSTDGDQVTHPLTCHSGGAIELFIEPFAPPLTVAVIGDSPIARRLAALCGAAGYDVRTDDEAAGATGAVVVATMGKGDEIAARAALLAGAGYVAVVASRRRAEALRAWLVEHDVPEASLAALHAPAGLDLGARTAEGVAVSILAEIVAERVRLGAAALAPPPLAPAPLETLPLVEDPVAPGIGRDPVCGMTVDLAATDLLAEHAGQTYGFCNPHCREAFMADPDRYLSTT
jgi:xanthine dehydrogenase accessory factor